VKWQCLTDLNNLRPVIKKKYGQDAMNVGDEGGFAPNIQENKGLELLKTAIAKAGYSGKRWRIQAKVNDDVDKFMSTEIVHSQHVSDKAIQID
ncbi:enolase, partial [Tanacetum coccineum]